MSRYYQTTFRESGTGKTLVFEGQGNTRNSAARAARRRLKEAVGNTTSWYEVTTRFVPKPERTP